MRFCAILIRFKGEFCRRRAAGRGFWGAADICHHQFWVGVMGGVILIVIAIQMEVVVPVSLTLSDSPSRYHLRARRYHLRKQQVYIMLILALIP